MNMLERRKYNDWNILFGIILVLLENKLSFDNVVLGVIGSFLLAIYY